MTDVQPQTATAPSRRPWAKIVLVLSLGLNLIFLGLVGGAVLRDGPHGRPTTVRDLNFGSLTEALSKTDRDTLRRSFQRAAPDLRGQRREAEGDLAELLTVLRAPDFQREKVHVLFARNNDRAARRQELGQNLVLDLLGAMAPDVRIAFADRLEAAMKRPKRPAGD
jgi:uncharacterized membrane protein